MKSNLDNITQLSPLVPIALMDYPIELELTSYIRTPGNCVASYTYSEELKNIILFLSAQGASLYPFNRVRWVRDSKTDQVVRIQFIQDAGNRTTPTSRLAPNNINQSNPINYHD